MNFSTIDKVSDKQSYLDTVSLEDIWKILFIYTSLQSRTTAQIKSNYFFSLPHSFHIWIVISLKSKSLITLAKSHLKI